MFKKEGVLILENREIKRTCKCQRIGTKHGTSSHHLQAPGTECRVRLTFCMRPQPRDGLRSQKLDGNLHRPARLLKTKVTVPRTLRHSPGQSTVMSEIACWMVKPYNRARLGMHSTLYECTPICVVSLCMACSSLSAQVVHVSAHEQCSKPCPQNKLC